MAPVAVARGRYKFGGWQLDRRTRRLTNPHGAPIGTDCGSSIPSADPQLDRMYIPIPRSPPMAAGDLATCRAFPVGRHDAYGGIRPQGPSCTIGAAEGNIPIWDEEIEKSNSDLWVRLKALLSPRAH